MTVVTPQRIVVPGSADPLEVVRDDDGHHRPRLDAELTEQVAMREVTLAGGLGHRLRELRGAGRCYLAGDATGTVAVDDLLEYREARRVDGFDRLVGGGGSAVARALRLARRPPRPRRRCRRAP